MIVSYSIFLNSQQIPNLHGYQMIYVHTAISCPNEINDYHFDIIKTGLLIKKNIHLL